MSLLRRGVESRAITDVPWDRGGARLMTGSAESALRLIPVYAATTGIADDVAITPLHTYRAGARIPSPTLVADPSPFGLGRIAWLHQACMSMLLRGFALGLVLSLDANGWPAKVAWVHPDRVQIDESRNAPRVLIDGREIPWAEVVYIPAAVLPGSIVGLSPVALFRLQLTKGQAAQQYAADFYDRGIMPPGILRNKAKILKPGEGEVARTRFRASVAGRDIFVTGNDWEWESLSVPKDDAQFLETIKATATEVAAIYRVSPEDIGGVTGASMTYQTLEMNELKRVRRAILPWARRFEDALTANLPRPQYAKFNLDALARADLLTRMQSHEIALRIGLETNDEGRALEDRAPLTGEQKAEWQNTYARQVAASTTTGAAK